MQRSFNTAGPNDPEDHHTLPVLARLPDIRHRIDEKRYFALHAPRQAGKTTALLALARELTGEGRYTAVVLSMESGAPFREEVGMAEDAILDAWQGASSRRLPAELRPPAWPSAPPGHRISRALQAWAEAAPRPLVVLLDEIDALEGVTLVSVLRQLRDGFPDRPHHFPWSLILSGRRDVPDYKLASGPGGHAESPFDIRSDPLTLNDFSHEGIAALYRQHTGDTGQVFLPVAIDRAFRLTRGQPWLVNALARQLVEVVVPDRTTAINAAHVEAARELLAARQEAHFESLAEQLHEPRLHAILAPMLRGEPLGEVPEGDRRLALDLGLVRSSDLGALAIANPIYRDVLVRLLASGRRAAPPELTATWVPAEGILDEEEAPAPAEAAAAAEPLLVTISRPPIAPRRALARVKRASLESFPPEELTEWFRPVSKVQAHAVGKPPAEALKAPVRGARRRSGVGQLVALAGAGCALVATIAWLVSGSERPAAATPAPGSSSVASMVQATGTPHSAPAAEWAATVVEVRDAQKPSSGPGASLGSGPGTSLRAPLRAPKPATVAASEVRPASRVVPSLPALPPPDSARMRRELEPIVWGGEASVAEIRMLKALCSSMGDRACRDRASELLKLKEL